MNPPGPASILLVTPFAPYRDGIATYAAQELRHLRTQGHRVEVLSPQPSAAHHYLPLGGANGAAMLAVQGAKYERVIVQFAPEMLFGRCRGASQRVAVWASLAALAKATKLELRIHEIEYGALEQNAAERRAAQLAIRLADQVSVHTEAERRLLEPTLGAAAARINVVDHGRYFAPAVECSSRSAKVELGLDPDEFAFVSIGFLQRHKGFDRAVEAFSLAGLASARLHIVGSGRVDHSDITQYVAQLAAMCAEAERVELHDRYVSDDQFDLWLNAADAVVLPYREIWSSGVVERARLFDTPVIVSDLDQLESQLGPEALTCSTISDFALAMEKLWSAAGFQRGDESDRGSDAYDERWFELGQAAPGAWEVDDEQPDRRSIQSQVRHRAGGEPMVSGSIPKRLPDQTSGRRLERPRAARNIEQLGPMPEPKPISARPGVTPVKQTVHRLIGWQVDPLVDRVAALQQATIDAVVELERRIDEVGAPLPDDVKDATAEENNERVDRVR